MRICSIIFFTFVLLSHSFGQMTKQDWKEDVQYMLSKIHELHPNLYYKFSKEAFSNAEEQLLKGIDKLSDEQIIASIARLLAMVEDGHTELIPMLRGPSRIQLHYLPFNFRVFEDGIYIRAIRDSSLTFTIGGKVLQVGNMSSKDLLKKLYRYTSGDNEYLKKFKVSMLLGNLEFLVGAGIIGKGEKPLIKIRTKDHKIITLTSPVSTTPAGGHGALPEKLGPDAPIYRQFVNKPYTIQYDPREQLLYLDYRQVASDPSFPVKRLVDTINYLARTETVQKFVIDLRNNGGGDLGLSIPLINGIKNNPLLNQRGRLFIIAGNFTFSAASFFLTKMQLNTRVITVGEPSGARPNHYGDARSVILPNSKLFVRSSVYEWQNIFPNDNRTTTSPDLLVVTSANDYFNERDPVLERIIGYELPTVKRVVSYNALGIDSSKRFFLNPVLLVQVRDEEGEGIVEVFDLDFEGRSYPYLTTKLYPASPGVYTTDIPGLTVEYISKQLSFQYNKARYNLTEKPVPQFDLKNFDNSAFQKLLQELDLHNSKKEWKVKPPSGFFTRSIISLLRNKLPEQAILLVEAGLKLMPQIYTLYYLKGEALSSMGRKEEALIAYKKAAAINIDDQNLANNIKKLEAEVNHTEKSK
ncbi:MAG: hypothetical protein ACXWV2_04640 [Chitinophagaceae bacterium]